MVARTRRETPAWRSSRDLSARWDEESKRCNPVSEVRSRHILKAGSSPMAGGGRGEEDDEEQQQQSEQSFLPKH